jgi:hypothetical protein
MHTTLSFLSSPEPPPISTLHSFPSHFCSDLRSSRDEAPLLPFSPTENRRARARPSAPRRGCCCFHPSPAFPILSLSVCPSLPLLTLINAFSCQGLLDVRRRRPRTCGSVPGIALVLVQRGDRKSTCAPSVADGNICMPPSHPPLRPVAHSPHGRRCGESDNSVPCRRSACRRARRGRGCLLSQSPISPFLSFWISLETLT